MTDLKGYRCPNCSSMIPISKSRGNIYKCEFCGSEFEKENDFLKPLMVETCEARLITLENSIRLNDHILADEKYKDGYIESSLKSVARQLAEQIVPYMEVKTYKDMATMTTVVGGRVRIAEPNTRLYDYLKNN